MSRTTMDLWVGVFVAMGIAALFFLALKVGSISGSDIQSPYLLSARFDNIGGLKVRAPSLFLEDDAGHQPGRIQVRGDAAMAILFAKAVFGMDGGAGGGDGGQQEQAEQWGGDAARPWRHGSFLKEKITILFYAANAYLIYYCF